MKHTRDLNNRELLGRRPLPAFSRLIRRVWPVPLKRGRNWVLVRRVQDGEKDVAVAGAALRIDDGG